MPKSSVLVYKHIYIGYIYCVFDSETVLFGFEDCPKVKWGSITSCENCGFIILHLPF